MPKISIRYQKISDAKRFFTILSNPNFIFIPTKVKSIEEERKWLKENGRKRKNKIQHNYSILFDALVVGAVGIRINQNRNHVGEIGYFLDENFWGQGITTKAVKLAEREAFKKLRLKRLEILMQPANKASEKVAIKNGYKKEGLMKKAVKNKQGHLRDLFLYAKTI